MERAINAPISAPVAARALPYAPESAATKTTRTKADNAPVETSRRIGLVSLWQDVVSVLGQRAAPIVIFAVLGFAAPVILGLLVQKIIAFGGYHRTGFTAFVYNKPSQTMLLIQAALNILGLTFARGVIAWLTLRGNWREACRVTLARYPALLLGSLVYGALIVAGAIGLSTLSRALRLDPNHVSQAVITLDGAKQLVTAKSFNALAPEVGLPFELVERLRAAPTATTVARVEIFAGYHETYYIVPSTSDPGFWLATLGSIALIAAAETLLRFRTITAFEATESRRLNIFTPLIASVLFGVKHFGCISLHVWLLRLIVWIFSVACCIAPAVLSQNFGASFVGRTMGWTGLNLLAALAISGSLALVNAFVAAFCTIYDAQLYLALKREPAVEAQRVPWGVPAAIHRNPLCASLRRSQ